MKKKGFTLIELLVVIAIIAMLLAILMPALNKVKKIAQRVICGTNLKGLGTGHMVYANDYDDAFVVANGTTWVESIVGFSNPAKVWPAPVTVGTSLYLLVREADVSPKSFICGPGGQTAYEGENTNPANPDITEMWDFGAYFASVPTPTPDTGMSRDHGPKNHVSFSYQMPYGPNGGAGPYAADGTRSAAFAVMADKNPWYDPQLRIGTVTAQNYMDYVRALGRYWVNPSLAKWRILSANAYPHSREGQNVLFGDGHSSYEKTPDVGVKHDNIYTIRAGSASNDDDIRMGTPGPYGIDNSYQPNGSQDSFLVNDDTGPRPG